MGKSVEKVATARGHDVVAKIDPNLSTSILNCPALVEAEVAVEEQDEEEVVSDENHLLADHKEAAEDAANAAAKLFEKAVEDPVGRLDQASETFLRHGSSWSAAEGARFVFCALRRLL